MGDRTATAMAGVMASIVRLAPGVAARVATGVAAAAAIVIATEAGEEALTTATIITGVVAGRRTALDRRTAGRADVTGIVALVMARVAAIGCAATGVAATVVTAGETAPQAGKPTLTAGAAGVVARRRTAAATTRPGGNHRSGCDWGGRDGISTRHPSRRQQQVRCIHE